MQFGKLFHEIIPPAHRQILGSENAHDARWVVFSIQIRCGELGDRNAVVGASRISIASPAPTSPAFMTARLDAARVREDAQIAETESFFDQLHTVAVWVAD